MDKSAPLPWLYLHFPCLQLDGLLTDHNESIDQPLIIVDGKHNQVLQLNQPAHQQGIKINMGIASAIALAPDLIVLDYQIDSEIQRLRSLAQRLYQNVADIALNEPNGLLLQTEHMLNLYGSLKAYWQKISKILHHEQLHFCWALAPTPAAARILAKNGHNDNTNQQYHEQALALTPQQIKSQLGELSVDCLEIKPQQIEQLHRLGINQIKQLWLLSTKAIGKRFGLELLTYLQQLKQHQGGLKNPYQPPNEYQQSLELLHEINQAKVLLFPLKRLIEQLEQFLLTRQLVTHEVTIELQYRQHQSTILTVASAQGEYQTEAWMRLISLKVEQLKLPDSVIAIMLSCGALIDKLSLNESLFAHSGPNNNGNSNNGNNAISQHQLVSILQAKVGKEHIFTLSLNDDHRPELAFNYLPINVHKRKKQLSAPSFKPPWQRPTFLLNNPQPLPQGYTIIAGPERIHSGWWSQDMNSNQVNCNHVNNNHSAIVRDYYIGKDLQGTLCWLYHEPKKGWFLHGYFS